MDYQLENLGPERFQQLCQALLVKEYPGITCLPVGQPDGGRDAFAPVVESQDQSSTIFQVKFIRSPQEKNITEWINEITTKELPKVKKLLARGAKLYIFITNAQGTAHLDSGSIDKTNAELTKSLGIPTVSLWRDDINRRLDGNWDIKLRYPEILSGQDFIRLLLETASRDDHERRLNAIRAFLADQYQEDLEVKFKQVELHNKLLDLFVDLPFIAKLRKWRPISTAMPFRMAVRAEASGGVILSPMSDDANASADDGTATLLLSEYADHYFSHVVVEGAPGQGKSTLAQYLCQAHRIRLLNKYQDLELLPNSHKIAPVRIPFKVDLRDLASWISGIDPFSAESKAAEPRSLEAFLAHLVKHHSGGIDFSSHDFIELSKIAPFLIVLDGLDEVADIKNRSEVVLSISRAIPRIMENCKGLRVVITSRPAAFANSPGFDVENFTNLQLGSVTKHQINKYAKRWMDVRTLTRKERSEFEAVLREKMDMPHLRDLARNPMQLTILLSLIHTRGAALPDKRTSLYDAYVDLFFSRESSKSSAVREHIDLLKDIHKYLGWFLHYTAETGDRHSGGRISADSLKKVIYDYLVAEQHGTSVLDDVFGAMLERVVMIVSRIEGTYEFEVQPLREYFAARHLYDTASYSPPGRERSGSKPDRFDAIAQNPYWLNVVRFFCGCFSKGELLDLADRVKALINSSVLSQSRHPVHLAAMLLADWVFSQSPKAIAHVATCLAEDRNIRKLISESALGVYGFPVNIPYSAGGSLLVKAALQLAFSPNVAEDLAHRISYFLSENADAAEIDSAWAASGSGPLNGHLTRWLWIGRIFGSAARVERQTIKAISGDEDLPISTIRALISAGRFDCIPITSRNEEATLNLMFDTAAASYNFASGAPAFLLPALFTVVELLYITNGAENREYFSEIISYFDKNFKELNPSHYNFLPDVSEKAHRISRNLSDILKFKSHERDEFRRIVELVNNSSKFWGDRPTITLAAVQLASISRKTSAQRRSLAKSLFDTDEPIYSRVMLARSQKDNPSWWIEHLNIATTAEQKLILHICLWSVVKVFSADLLTALDKSLNELSEEVWRELLLSIRRLHVYGHSRKPIKWSALPGMFSLRLSMLLSLKKGRDFDIQSFMFFLEKSLPDTPLMADLYCKYSLIFAQSGKLPWDKAMQIIRKSYTVGTGFDPTGYPTRGERKSLPKNIVDEILKNETLYPMSLVDSAYAAIDAQTRKKIVPVGEIAKRDAWFSIENA